MLMNEASAASDQLERDRACVRRYHQKRRAVDLAFRHRHRFENLTPEQIEQRRASNRERQKRRRERRKLAAATTTN